MDHSPCSQNSSVQQVLEKCRLSSLASFWKAPCKPSVMPITPGNLVLVSVRWSRDTLDCIPMPGGRRLLWLQSSCVRFSICIFFLCQCNCPWQPLFSPLQNDCFLFTIDKKLLSQDCVIVSKTQLDFQWETCFLNKEGMLLVHVMFCLWRPFLFPLTLMVVFWRTS